MTKRILYLLFASLFPVTIWAQGSITGTITDAQTGETIPGANVYIPELERGDASDVDGVYNIANIPEGSYTLTVTYVGYSTHEQTVQVGSGQTVVVNIEMQMGAIGLDELVVSGYASVNKRELTGSIASVSSEEIENISLQNTEGLLQGRAAGVTVTSASGNPGGAFRVTIRGNGSVNAATEPLYVVDGVPLSFEGQSTQASSSPLNAINPSDIESIEVLKDAASASIYGAQAAAGVVIITTKRGRAGATQITARAETGVRSLARSVDYVSTPEYLDYLGEARFFNGTSPSIEAGREVYENFFIDYFGTPNNDGVLADYDWQDFIYEEGATQKYNITASGGSESTRFYLGGGFEDTQGTALNSDFTRLNLRSNVDHTVNERFNTSVNINLSRSTQFGVCQGGNYTNCPTSLAMLESRMSFPFLEDGSYNPLTNFGLASNPAVIRDEVDRNVSVLSIISDVKLTYRLTDWLNVSGFAGVDYRNTEDERFDSVIANSGDNGSIFFANRNVFNSTMNAVVNASQTFDGVHNVSGFAGIEYRRVYDEFVSTRGIGLPGQFFKVLGATAEPTIADGSNTEWRQGSYFGTLRYNYDEKYMLTFVARYDGNSRFGADTRWGFFPSFSGAWRISEEDFFDVDVLDELKLRVGYGITGNSRIGNFASRGLFSTAGTYQGSTALSPSQLANVNLGWEEAKELNIGLDYEFLQGRITGAVDVYNKTIDELLFARPLPFDSGFSSITENIGSIRNRGIEFEISSVNINTRDFQWNTRFNISFTENEILELPNGEDVNPTSTTEALKIGKPIGLIQVPRWAGVNPADGRPMWYNAEGHITYNPEQAVDGIEYKDGRENITGGFGNTLSYKGFTLDAFFQYSFGQWAFASTDYYFTRTPDFYSTMSAEVRDRWRQPGDQTYYPRAITVGGDFPETADYRTQMGTQAIYNASYIRLKNVMLSYNLPASVTQRIGLADVRLFASAINLLTWTAWPWYDPEVAFDTRDIYTNVTTASYPTERQINAGIEIRF